MKLQNVKLCYFFTIVTAFIFYMLIPTFAFAEPAGACISSSGTKIYNFNFTSILTDPSKNKAGTIIDPAYTWNLGGATSAVCSCPASAGPIKYKAEIPALSYDRSISGLNYYNLNNNLSVASQVYVAAGVSNYIPTPFVDFSNNGGSNCGEPYSIGTGNSGKVSLFFKKAFVGQSIIPSTTILNIYGTLTAGSYSATPLSSVIMAGTVTVPQSCQINDGQVIDVDYGSMLNTALKTKGAGPDGFTAKVTQLAYVCTNISEGVKLSFTFRGQTSPADANSFSTNNADIGVRLENMSGGAITPNSGELPAQLDYASQSGSTSFRSYPVNTTGNTPATGAFSSTATITTNME